MWAGRCQAACCPPAQRRQHAPPQHGRRWVPATIMLAQQPAPALCRVLQQPPIMHSCTVQGAHKWQGCSLALAYQDRGLRALGSAP